MRPDDVKGALDALASEVPGPTRDAVEAIARGRRRISQRRFALVGVAVLLIAVISVVGAVSHTNHPRRVDLSGPAPTTPIRRTGVVGLPASEISVASATEAWKCINPLQYTNDGGQSWQDFELPSSARRSGVECTALPGGNVWAMWAEAGVWHLSRIRDHGPVQTFSLPPVPATSEISRPTFVDASHGWVEIGPPGEGDTFLYRTVDGGATWKLASDDQPLPGTPTFVDDTRGWARSGNTLYATTDGGSSWHAVALPAPRHAPGVRVDHFQVVAHGNSIVIQSGTPIAGSLFRDRTFFDVSADSGKTWAVRAGPTGFEVANAEDNHFDASDGSHWAVVSGTALRVTDDGGRTWQNRPKVPGDNLHGTAAWQIVFPTADVGWATSEVGRTWRTTDSGRTWIEVTYGYIPNTTPASTPTTPAAPAVPVFIPLAFVSPTQGWICDSPLLYSAHGAATSPSFTNNWHTIDIPTHPPKLPNFQYPLCTAIPGGEAWVLTAAADPSRAQLIRIETAEAKKETFALPQLDTSATYVGLTFVDAAHGWAVGEQTNGTPTARLFATNDGGKTWSVRSNNAPINADSGQTPPLKFVSDTDGWAIGSGNDLEHTTDGGRTWRAVTLPAPFVGPGVAKYVNAVVPTASGAIVAAGGQQSGTDTVPFFDVSTDGGSTWVSRAGPPGITFGATVPSAFGALDSEHWQYAYANYLFLTADGGRTWTQVAQFAGMAKPTSVEFVTPEAGFVAGVGDPPDEAAAYVLQTLDGGASWSTVAEHAPPFSGSPNVVNFPGGIIGCPTRPLTPPPPGNPPAGLVDTARAYVGSFGGSGPRSGPGSVTVVAVHPASRPTKGFENLFGYQVGSCGTQALADSWVVQLSIVSTDRSSIDEIQLALAHAADGWHVFGRYP